VARVGLLASRGRASIAERREKMLYWAAVFLIIALVAGAFGFLGIAGTAASIAKILFFVFIVIFVVSLLTGMGRRRL
jgi:uncharacterized membrane protein YtjA (UPF0391 family)